MNSPISVFVNSFTVKKIIYTSNICTIFIGEDHESFYDIQNITAFVFLTFIDMNKKYLTIK